MNRTLVVIVAVAVLLLGSVVSANAAPRMRLNIPFEFHAGTQVMPAGEYWVEFRALGGASATGSTIYILNHNLAVVHILPAMASTRAGVSQDYLLFNRYGEDYFLAKACQGSYEATPSKTGAEREIALAYSRTQTTKRVVIAAIN